MQALVLLLLGVTSAQKVIELGLKTSSSSSRRLADYDYRDKTLGNYNNYQYTTSVYVGSRQQRLNLVLDTGSVEMWFAGPNCANPSQCPNQIYQSDASQSFATTE